jgi:monoamine oxidase
MTVEEADARCDELPYERAAHERGQTATQMWDGALADLRATLARDGDTGWARIVAEHDQYSLYEFLQARGWSEGAIEMFGVLHFLESDLHNAAVEVLREDLGGFYSDMVEIVGGMDRLPEALYGPIAHRVRFGAEVVALRQDDQAVTVHYRTRAGRFSLDADYCICAIPFSVLRHVEVLTPFSRPKQKAIRQLNYAASTKVLLQVSRRFWEETDGILGGATCTDLPIRRLNYPTPDPGNPRGVLLASYTWSQDALRWGSMDSQTRIEQALEDVAVIHPEIRETFEVGASHAWYGDRWAGGAFALFEPEQQTHLHDAIVAAEGRVRFAGEHCSLYHAWIQGALESGLAAARQIHREPAGIGSARG